MTIHKSGAIKRLRFNLNSVKEAFDNLPSGVCFFYKNGIPVLCNHRMNELAAMLLGHSVQNMQDLLDALDSPEKTGKVTTDGESWFFPDGTVWSFGVEPITDSCGYEYIQIAASDITTLHGRKRELLLENEQIKKTSEELRRLSANVVAQTRELEILSMKMRVHDDIGSGMLAAHQILKQNRPVSDADSIIASWEKALELLENTNSDIPEKDDLTQLKELSAGIGIEIIIDGKMPEKGETAYLIVTAMRECVTNAVRYAKAGRLFVKLSHSGNKVTAAITNDGIPPEKDIVEGCGLSTLRRRIIFAGGNMTVRSLPYFELNVTLPNGGEK